MPAKISSEPTCRHPRPQLRRDGWISLDGPWKFCFDDTGRLRQPADVVEWPLTIQVPFAPESKASGIGDTGFHRACWYQREFAAGRPPDGGRLMLHFGAVDYAARVWVNGSYIGSHEGGHTPFALDITDALAGGGPQTRQIVTVRAEDDPHDLAKPRGKQDWHLEPHVIWYPRTTGIWQSVWLEPLPAVYIDRIRWTPLLERWEIGIEAFLGGAVEEGLELKLCLRAGDQLLANDSYQVIQSEVYRRIALSDPGIDDFRNELLWSPEKPTLMEATLELWGPGGRIDRVESYTALRNVSIQRGDFMLNGRPYTMRLALDQGYWPDTLMTPPSDEALRRDVELAKALGFNGVRKHQKIECPTFLYWADVLGLLVWEEMPSAYRFTHDAVERIVREWIEVIDRDSSHPCVVVWVPFNESWGVPDLAEKATHRSCVQALYHLTKTLDPTRPVVGNDGWEATATDIIGIHDYDNDPERLEERYGDGVAVNELLNRRGPAGRILKLSDYPHAEQPILLTEFGGFSYTGECDDAGQAKSWGYGVCGTAEEFRRRLGALVGAVRGLELFRGFCYTQLTDTFQETNGLLFADRTPKLPLHEIAAIVRGDDASWAQAAVSGAPADDEKS